MGVDKGTAIGFEAIHLRFALDTDASQEQLATLLRLTERYCVVLQTLRQPPRIDAAVLDVTASTGHVEVQARLR